MIWIRCRSCRWSRELSPCCEPAALTAGSAEQGREASAVLEPSERSRPVQQRVLREQPIGDLLIGEVSPHRQHHARQVIAHGIVPELEREVHLLERAADSKEFRSVGKGVGGRSQPGGGFGPGQEGAVENETRHPVRGDPALLRTKVATAATISSRSAASVFQVTS